MLATRKPSAQSGLTAVLAVGIKLRMTSGEAPVVRTGQTPLRVDVISHLSDREQKRYRRINRRFPVIVGVTTAIAYLISAFLVRNFHPVHEFRTRLLVFLPVAFVLNLLIQRWCTRSLKAFLASTEYAKSQGIGPDGVRLTPLTGCW